MTVTIQLQRDAVDALWGFRLRGGVDIGEPLVVQRVFTGSPADGELQRGDQIVKIDKTDATKLTHQEAHDILKNAGTKVALAINRVAGGVVPPPQAAPRTAVQKTVEGVTTITTTHTSSSMSTRKVTTVTGQSFPKKFSQVVQSPLDNLPMSVFEAAQTFVVDEDLDKQRERTQVTNQPYRTLPLVLPSPKPKKDTAPVCQSYLKMQAGSAFQNPPSSSPLPPHPVVSSVNETLLQQKLDQASVVLEAAATNAPVVDTVPQPQVVHNQFNSPLNLYSAENVAKTIEQQTGVLKNLSKPTAAVNPEARAPPKPAPEPESVSALGPASKVYDPHQSPTYQALIEENEKEVTTEMRPPVAKVYTAPKAPKIPPEGKPKKNPMEDYLNSLGTSNEKIYQSYSFNKIMADVLGESEF